MSGVYPNLFKPFVSTVSMEAVRASKSLNLISILVNFQANATNREIWIFLIEVLILFYFSLLCKGCFIGRERQTRQTGPTAHRRSRKLLLGDLFETRNKMSCRQRKTRGLSGKMQQARDNRSGGQGVLVHAHLQTQSANGRR